jgi:hypothetical protein
MNTKILSQFFGKPVSDELLNSISPELRLQLIVHAKALSELVGSWEEKLPVETFLVSLLKKFNLKVSPSILEKIADDDEFEIWTLDGKFMASSGKFYKMTSWSIEDLLNKDRAELFTRDDKYLHQVIHSLTSIGQGASYIENPCEAHVVTETKKDPVSVMVKMKYFAPVYSAAEKNLIGVIAVINFKPLHY